MPRRDALPISQSRWASQVAQSTDFSNQFVGSPSLIIDSSGTMWASHNWFYGDSTAQNQTLIYRSDNNGGSWSLVRTITGLYWAGLFEYGGDLYCLGVNERNATTGGGDIVLFKSTDEWVSAPSSVTLFSDQEYQTAGSVPIVSDGYLMIACTERDSPTFAQDFTLTVIFGDVSDLMNAASWGRSNLLAYSQGDNLSGWSGTNSGWLEPQIVNDGGTLRVLARMHTTFEHKAAMVSVSWTPATPAMTLSFSAPSGFIDLLGGSVRFELVYHTGAAVWLAITNHRTATRVADPNSQRDELWLIKSSDLSTWTAVKQLHGSETERGIGKGVAFDGFQYVSNVLSSDENTMHYLSRTGWRGSPNEHDANRLTYDFIPNLNALLGV